MQVISALLCGLVIATPSLAAQSLATQAAIQPNLRVSQAQDSLPVENQSVFPENTIQQLIVQQLLHESGIVELLRQLPNLIDQEMANLKATPVPFSDEELIKIRFELERRLAVTELKKHLRDKLQAALSEESLRQVQALLQSQTVEQFKRLQIAMQDESIQYDIRAYKAKVKGDAPRGGRVELMETLNKALYQRRIETDLKVELRKNLLASVSWIKSNELINEAMLEKELAQYRERVLQQIDSDARIYFLYMFKRTPSNELKDLIAAYGAPEFKLFMATCNQALVEAFRTARAESISALSLAEAN